MLSLFNVGAGKAAAKYYETADDYYTDGVSPSRWVGQGAAHLGLSGSVDAAIFADLLDGTLPTGETLHRGSYGRRGGTDATFSAPKSASLQALVGGDRHIVLAHHTAVDRALAYMETLASCRVTINGVTRSERTGNLVIAAFEHDLSRAAQPQLHSHCVLINSTRRIDGQWRALDNQQIYRNKMLLGVLYRSELARELQNLEYGVRVTHADGRFELAHINDSQIRAFSSRSAAIEAYLKENKGLERWEASAWNKKLVAVLTRDKKTQVDRNFLHADWQRLSQESGIDYSVMAQQQFVPSLNDLAPIVLQAVEHLTERQSVFNYQAILKATLERSVGVATLEEIEVALHNAVVRGDLVQDGDRFTTHAAQQMERDILGIEFHGRGVLSPIYSGDRSMLRSQLPRSLNDQQKNAVLAMLVSSNRVTGIQGRAGVGKTTLLKSAVEQALAAGYVVKGLAPSASAARELSKGTGIDAKTITSFMRSTSKGLNSNVLLIVDEAGMASTNQMHAILSEAEKANCRVVLVGDTLQLEAVEAGKPFAQLQNNGMHTYIVSEIQRQKSPLLKQSVELAVDGKTGMAIELLDKHIVEINSSADRFHRIASDYMALTEAERGNTRVIAGTRYARAAINQSIREKLGLATQGQNFTMLERKDMTKAQASSILSYETRDLLVAEADYRSMGVKRGDVLKVIERQDHCILVEREDGGRAIWHPARTSNLSAYVPVNRQLTVGDLVRVTANDRIRGLINGDLAQVTDIDQSSQSVTLKFEDGRNVMLDGSRPLALDYGYCSTVYAAQGQTCDRVLIEADTQSLTANEKSFYVAISRARYHAQIYTDDAELLPLSMSRSIEKEVALSVQVPELEIS